MATSSKAKKESIRLDVENYVNTETGETLDSALQQKTLTVKEEGNFVILQSDDYVVIDSEALKYMRHLLSTTDISHTVQMSANLKTPFNIVYNNNVPHTNETLQNFLGFRSKAMFLKLIKRLIKVGVLYQVKGRIMGGVRVIYMFNPLIARKRRSVDKQMMAIFCDIKKTPIPVKTIKE
jgi:predicted transcriptional regulator